MIIDKLTLFNFGIYKGKHEIDLSPKKKKNIVLIGALNGGGKTTLLDALQVALYGPRANYSDKGKVQYKKYLKESVNENTNASAGAYIQLQFRHHTDGNEHKYTIKRSWQPKGDGVQENFTIMYDEKSDPSLSERWDEHIEEIMPAAIAHLFFFDGEKIEALADLDNAKELLRVAINSLLGVDIVDQLMIDLKTLERRKKTALLDNEKQKEIESIQQIIIQKEAAIQEKVEKLKGLQEQQANIESELEKIESDYRKQGGTLFEQREELENTKKELSDELNNLHNQQLEIYSQEFPFLLVPDLLQEVITQDKSEVDAENAQRFGTFLETRDHEIIKMANTWGLGDLAISQMEKYLKNDRIDFLKSSDIECYLNLDEQSRRLLNELPHVLKQLETKLNIVQTSIKKTEAAIDEIDKKLTAIPEEDAIKELIDQRKQKEQEKLELEFRINYIINEELERMNRDLNQRKTSLANKIESNLDGKFAQEDNMRVSQYCKNVQPVLQKFHKALIESHISQIQNLILECFQGLLRKTSLIHSIKIDPVTFEMSILNNSGKSIKPKRLSAGERQLLAVSMLWGLARASGRPLPTVIDTPLGRLDSKHRINLVEQYYPNASHQVLILSTDKEIEHKYYKSLKPFIAHEYTIEFDEAEKTSTIKEGYSFKKAYNTKRK